MKQHLFVSVFIFIYFGFVFNSFSQVEAGFTVNKSSGCSPLVVVFTNTSTPAGSLTYTWTFDDQGTSHAEDPEFVFIASRSYTITLSVTDGVNTDIATTVITVYANPTANFTAANVGCSPATIQFYDASTKGGGDIEYWNWDFRQGSPSHVQNPTHYYSSPGQYNVFLEIIDENGCAANIEKTNFISLAAQPVANFSFTPPSACSVPQLFNFTNKSVIGGTATYNWTFGDGGTSTAYQPSHTYNNLNTYQVVLVVNGENGCTDDIQKSLVIGNVIADGTLSQSGNVLNSNDTVCTGLVSFLNESVGTNDVLWNFGDGQISTSPQGFHSYNVQGTYPVTLTAAPSTSCSDTKTWTVFVERVSSVFTMNSTYSCSSPINVQFTNQSTNAVSYLWTFAGGQTSTSTNVTHTYAIPPVTNEYQVSNPVSFNTILRATSNHGCQSTTNHYLVINTPTALFQIDTSKGCEPLNVSFTNFSVSEEPITNYRWIFGDGQTGSSNPAVHNYTNDGDYTARLVITNSLNCIDTSHTVDIEIGKILNPNFHLSIASACPNEQIQFFDDTPESNLIDSWYYYVGNVSVNPAGDEADPFWIVEGDAGNQNVRLVVDYNGCLSETTKNNAFFNEGPVSNFTYAFDCDAPYTYQFTNTSIGASTFLWDFGDGSTNSSTLNPSHLYIDEGDYEVSLLTYEGGCSDTLTVIIPVREPKATMSSFNEACSNTLVAFSGDGSYNAHNSTHNYYWDFGDIDTIYTISYNPIQHEFASRGTFPVKLYTQYDNGCVDSISKNVRIYEPITTFSPDTSLGCSPFDVVFTDNSTPDVSSLVLWAWDFDDGTSNLSYSTQRPTVDHTFATPGQYDVTLTLRDSRGCVGTFSTLISTANPTAQFFVNDATGCTGTPIQFSAVYPDADSLVWDFGDGTMVTINSIPALYSYSEEGEYGVTLSVYRFGCNEIFSTASDYIKIQDANATFAISDTMVNCYPEEITFTHNPGSTIIESGLWDFDYGNGTALYDEVMHFTYPLPGTFHPSLIISTSYGCSDTYSRSISLSGPTGSFSVAPEQACRGDEIIFTIIDTSGVNDFEWYFGDGMVGYGNPVSHNYYTIVGRILPTLLLHGANDCSPAIQDTLYLYEVVADFEADTQFCEGYDITFINNSSGNYYNHWDLGNGTTSLLEEPMVNYSVGNYTVELQIENSVGCADTAELSFAISPIPEISVSDGNLICQGDSIQLLATGGTSIAWTPVIGLDSANSYTPIAQPFSSTLYTAVVSDTAGCQDSDDVLIIVVPQPFLNLSPSPDTTVVIGEYIYVEADSSEFFTYLWSPSDYLNCTNCARPVIRPLSATQYTVVVTDTSGCFDPLTETLSVDIIEEYRLTVPKAFTPNGDGINDVIYVKGWGIKTLLEFRIFNRWGNEVFYSDDLQFGWDGTFKGKIQNIDSYGYVARAEMWDGNVMTAKGIINLLR